MSEYDRLAPVEQDHPTLTDSSGIVFAYVAQLERERDVLRVKEGRCPIGLDETPEVCSDGHCYQCRAISAEHYNGYAKTEIVTLQTEVKKLREALKQIVAMDPKGVRVDDLGRAVRIARIALEVKE